MQYPHGKGCILCPNERERQENQRETSGEKRYTGVMRPRLTAACVAIALALLPFMAFAQGGPAFFMKVCWLGIACLTNAQIILKILTALFTSAALVCVAIFLIGAACLVFSAGNDTLLQKGKGMMVGSMIGLALIVGSFGIYRTVIFILYAGP